MPFAKKKTNDCPMVQPNDGPGLRNFSDFLDHCETAMTTIHYWKVLNDPDKNQKTIKKLPTHIVARWSRVVDKWLAEEEPEEGCLNLERQCFKPEYPPFSEFCKFMRKEARIASTPVTSPKAMKVEETKPRFDTARMRPNPGEKRNFGTKTLATRSSEESVTDYAVNGLFSNAKRIAHS